MPFSLRARKLRPRRVPRHRPNELHQKRPAEFTRAKNEKRSTSDRASRKPHPNHHRQPSKRNLSVDRPTCECPALTKRVNQAQRCRLTEAPTSRVTNTHQTTATQCRCPSVATSNSIGRKCSNPIPPTLRLSSATGTAWAAITHNRTRHCPAPYDSPRPHRSPDTRSRRPTFCVVYRTSRMPSLRMAFWD